MASDEVLSEVKDKSCLVAEELCQGEEASITDWSLDINQVSSSKAMQCIQSLVNYLFESGLWNWQWEIDHTLEDSKPLAQDEFAQ